MVPPEPWRHSYRCEEPGRNSAGLFFSISGPSGRLVETCPAAGPLEFDASRDPSSWAAALLIAIALSIELLFVAASTAGSARAGGGSLGTAIGVGAFVAVMMPIGAVLGAVVFAGVSAPVLIAGLGFGAAALLFTAVAELLVEAYEIKESTGTIAMAAGGFLLFLILMMLM